MDEYDRGYKDGFAEGQKKTVSKMSKAAFRVSTKLRDKIGRLENIIDYLKTCVSCAEFNCQKKRCNLQSGSCVNLNKWRMPE